MLARLRSFRRESPGSPLLAWACDGVPPASAAVLTWPPPLRLCVSGAHANPRWSYLEICTLTTSVKILIPHTVTVGGLGGQIFRGVQVNPLKRHCPKWRVGR